MGDWDCYQSHYVTFRSLVLKCVIIYLCSYAVGISRYITYLQIQQEQQRKTTYHWTTMVIALWFTGWAFYDRHHHS